MRDAQCATSFQIIAEILLYFFFAVTALVAVAFAAGDLAAGAFAGDFTALAAVAFTAGAFTAVALTAVAFAAGAFTAVAFAAGALALAAGALLGADFAAAVATLLPGFAAFGLLTVFDAFGAAALPVVTFLAITHSLSSQKICKKPLLRGDLLSCCQSAQKAQFQFDRKKKRIYYEKPKSAAFKRGQAGCLPTVAYRRLDRR